MKKIFLALCLIFLSVTAFSQQGLQGVIVEKYHVATVADNAADPTLPVGAVTYRVFIYMQDGWRLRSIFGSVDDAQNVVIRTSAANGFWNRTAANGGRRWGHQINFAALAGSSLRYDSWLGMGAAAAPNANGTDFYHGIPVSIANPTGIITLAVPTRVLAGEVNGDQRTILYPMMEGTSTVNNYTSADFGLYDTDNANWLAGADSDNRLLIGQFTTTGDFTYQFNIAVNRTSDNLSELYVAENEIAGQFLFPALRGYRGLPTPPAVSITSVLPLPNTYVEGAVVTITANATDAGGITRLEFFSGSTSIGLGTRVGTTNDYTLVWTSTPTAGPLTAVATDNEDTQTTSAPVNITVTSAAGYSIPRQRVSCNSSDLIYVPVNTKNPVANVIGFDLVMAYDKLKVRPTGEIKVNSDLVNPAYVSYATRIIKSATDSIKISLFLNASAPAGTVFAGAAERQVLSVEFAKTLAFLPSDSVTFNIPFVTESRISGINKQGVEQGRYVTYTESLFTGYLKSWSDNAPIVYTSGVNLITNITGNATGHGPAVQPDAVEGKFVYNINNGLTINIDRYIDNATPVNTVITGYDAYLTQKVVLGDASFRPNVFQIMAMDVNMDKKVTAGDVSQILQRSTSRYGEFRTRINYNDAGQLIGQPTLDWYFVDNRSLYGDPETGTHGYAAFKISASYPESDGVGYSRHNAPSWPWNNLGIPVKDAATCPIIYEEEYQGIMIGDVDGSYKNIASSPTLKSATIGAKSADNSDNVLFDLSKATVVEGFITFPVSVSSKTDINSLDFAMQFDESKVTFKEVVNHSADMQSAFYFNEADKTMRFSSFSMQKYSVEAPVVSVRFELKDKNNPNVELKSLTAYLNGAPVAVKTNELKIRDNQDRIRIYPNPARNFTTIVLTENADIKILDVNGKLIREEKNVAAYDERIINLSGLPQGIYFMKISMKVGNDVFVSTRKVVIKK
jgi:hypothetical protein